MMKKMIGKTISRWNLDSQPGGNLLDGCDVEDSQHRRYGTTNQDTQIGTYLRNIEPHDVAENQEEDSDGS